MTLCEETDNCKLDPYCPFYRNCYPIELKPLELEGDTNIMNHRGSKFDAVANFVADLMRKQARSWQLKEEVNTLPVIEVTIILYPEDRIGLAEAIKRDQENNR